ncbi:WLM domain-containing protein, partial [Kalaharituber pfeilii]
IIVTHRSTPHTFDLPPTSTLQDLSFLIENALSIPPAYQKILAPKLGLLKDPTTPVTALSGKKLTLMGSSQSEVTSIQSASSHTTKSRPQRLGSGPIKPARPASRSKVDPSRAIADATYTFLELRPLPYLPHPERSLAYLERIRDDPGIRFVMRKHKWTVPLLLEMNPADHTSHESKTLGLNLNRGEIIELRIRTDDYGGYRDYKTVRRTVVHELCHNVHDDHDRNFWDLFKVLEQEVARADWTAGGKSLTDREFYEPPGGGRYLGEEEEGEIDEGGCTGGEYVLGGAEFGGQGLTRREVLARAAEER